MMNKNEIAEALGSQRVVEVQTQISGPLTYLSLIREFNTRIAKKIECPTDCKETKYHNIPIADETWEKLEEKAKLIPGENTLSASHLAAFLIEHGLHKLEEEINVYDLKNIH